MTGDLRHGMPPFLPQRCASTVCNTVALSKAAPQRAKKSHRRLCSLANRDPARRRSLTPLPLARHARPMSEGAPESRATGRRREERPTVCPPCPASADGWRVSGTKAIKHKERRDTHVCFGVGPDESLGLLVHGDAVRPAELPADEVPAVASVGVRPVDAREVAPVRPEDPPVETNAPHRQRCLIPPADGHKPSRPSPLWPPPTSAHPRSE